jgi:hypothetical protein
MLTGFGAFGTEPGILPPNGVPPMPGLTETAIVQLGKQMQEDQRCAQSNGEIYCLSKESHLKKEKFIYFGVGIAGGIALGALVGYMVG